MNNRKKYGLIGLIIVIVLIILFVWGFSSGVGTDHDSAPERADANATTGDSVQATSSPMDKDKYLNQFLREQDDIMEDMMEEMEEDRRLWSKRYQERTGLSDKIWRTVVPA